MKFITGDECGVIKEFVPNRKQQQQTEPGEAIPIITNVGIQRWNNVDDDMHRANGIVGVTIQQQQQSCDSIAALRIDGRIEIWDTTSKTKSISYNSVFRNATATTTILPKSNNRAIGLHSVFRNGKPPLLCACNARGDVSVIETNNNDQQQNENSKNPTIVREFNAYGVNDDDDSTKNIPYCTAFTVGGDGTTSAVGGKNRETILHNVETGQEIWKAKNLPPDPQTLLAPQVWVTSLAFMEENANILVAGTKYNQIRVYDIRTKNAAGIVQRRPIAFTPHDYDKNVFLEHAVTAVTPGRVSKNEVVVGDAAGYIHAIDMRKLSGGTTVVKHSQHSHEAVIGRYVGPGGSVRDLQVVVTTKSKSVLAAVGLDRMLRVYDMQTRRPIHTVYMKQRLNCVLAIQDSTTSTNDDDDDSDANQNSDSEDVNQDDDVRDYVDSDNDDHMEEDSVHVVEDIDDIPSSDGESSNNTNDSDSSNEKNQSSRKRQRQ